MELAFRGWSDTSGVITTIAGNGYAEYDWDGVSATIAALNGPSDVAIDSDGNIDEFNIDATGRYMRFTGLERATEWGHSFYE